MGGHWGTSCAQALQRYRPTGWGGRGPTRGRSVSACRTHRLPAIHVNFASERKNPI
jgi:hypothetical protein